MELGPPLYLDVEAIEKGAFGSLSTTVVNFTFFYIIIITEIVRVGAGFKAQ